MNNPPGSQNGNSDASRQRPAAVSALALLVALDAIGEGCGGITRVLQAGSSLAGEITAVFLSVLIVVMLVLAGGLWKMKNWARIGLIITIIIGFLLSIPQWVSISPDNPAITVFVILLALVFRVVIIYWLAANGKYFNNTAIAPANPGETTGVGTPAGISNAGSSMSQASLNTGGSNGISRSTIVGLSVGAGLIAIIVCVTIGYFVYVGNKPFAHQVSYFGSKGSGQGMLNEPDTIGLDGNGNIVVGDFKDGRVQTYTAGGKFISSFTVPTGSGGTSEVTGMAVSRDGTIYITGDIDSAILIYNEQGTFLGQIVDTTNNYADVALGPDGTLYALTDISIRRFKKDGSVDMNVQISDTVNSSHLAVDSLGNIYVTDFVSDQVFKFSPAGVLLTQFSRGGNKANSVPTQIAIDAYGRILLNDTAGNVQVFDSNGQHLGNIPGTYDGLAFDKQNNLYTNDIVSGEVIEYQILQPAKGTPAAVDANRASNNPVLPTPTASFASNTSTFSGTIVFPIQAIGVTGNGNIVLGYSDGHLQTFDSSGKFISTILIALPSAADGPGSLAIGKKWNNLCRTRWKYLCIRWQRQAASNDPG